jgi:hypothetical protein
MKYDSKQLYIDLIRKTLAFSLWPEPPQPIITRNYKNPPVIKQIISGISGALGAVNLELVRHRKFTEEDRQQGKIWPGYADTMVGMKRLENLQYCVETVINDGIEGDLIETGVWRGGSCIFMRAILAAYGDETRKVYVADSFEGLPKPDPKHPADKGDKHYIQDVLAISQEEVEENFIKYGLLDEQVVFLKGWFKDTLPTLESEKLAVIRLDGDMYSSTMDAFNNLYHKLQPGGFCIIDDYALPNCKAAVDTFRQENGIASELQEIDWTGRFWRKE